MKKDDLLKFKCFVDNEFLDKYIDIVCSVYEPCDDMEKHHIIPRMVFKKYGITLDNSDENIVLLPYMKHVLAHYYLSKCTCSDIKYKNLYAMAIIYGKRDITEEEIFDNDNDLQEFRKYRHKLLSKNNSMKNPNILERHNEIMRSDAVRKKISDTMRKVRAETDDVLIYKGHEGKRVLKSEVDKYLSDGWNIGNKQAQFIRINKDGVKKTIFEDEWELYERDGWKRGNLQTLSENHKKALESSHYKTVSVLLKDGTKLKTFNSVRDTCNWWFNNQDTYPIPVYQNEFVYKTLAGYIRKSFKNKKYYGDIMFLYEGGDAND